MAMSVAPIDTVQLQLPQNHLGGGTQREYKPTRRLKFNAAKLLEPANKKLTTIETQRVLAVLEETIKKVELTSVLDYVADYLDRFRVGFGSQLVHLIETHTLLKNQYAEREKQLEKLLGKKALASGLTSPAPTTGDDGATVERVAVAVSPEMTREESKHQVELTQLECQLTFSTKNILRSFALNPAATELALQRRDMRSEDWDDVVEQLNKMKKFLLERLLTTPAEEREKNANLDLISEEQQKHKDMVEKLELQLEVGEKNKTDQIQVKNDEIRSLQLAIHNLEKMSEDQIRRMKTDSEKQELQDIKNSESRTAKLQQELSQLKNQLQSQVNTHRDSEALLRKKKYKLETEVESWISKYDGDMSSRLEESEEIQGIYNEEKSQLDELEGRFKTLEEEYRMIVDERRIAQEARDEAERILQLSIKAATLIQACWRSFKVRKMLRGGGKKKKGKSGKGKKGKKGK